MIAGLYDAVKNHGNLDVPLPHGPDFFQFSDETKMQLALIECGLVDVEGDLSADATGPPLPHGCRELGRPPGEVHRRRAAGAGSRDTGSSQ